MYARDGVIQKCMLFDIDLLLCTPSAHTHTLLLCVCVCVRETRCAFIDTEAEVGTLGHLRIHVLLTTEVEIETCIINISPTTIISFVISTQNYVYILKIIVLIYPLPRHTHHVHKSCGSYVTLCNPAGQRVSH